MSDTTFNSISSFEDDLKNIKPKARDDKDMLVPVVFGSLFIICVVVKLAPIAIEAMTSFYATYSGFIAPLSVGATAVSVATNKVRTKLKEQAKAIINYKQKVYNLTNQTSNLKTKLQSVNQLLVTKEEAITLLETDKQSALDEVTEISHKLKEVKNEVKQVSIVEPILDLNIQVKLDELQAKYDKLEDQNLMLELERDELIEQSKLVKELESVEEFSISKPKVKQISQEDKLSMFFDSYKTFSRNDLKKSMPDLGNSAIQHVVNGLIADRTIQVFKNGNFKVLQSV